jgi:hypothetical protein
MSWKAILKNTTEINQFKEDYKAFNTKFVKAFQSNYNNSDVGHQLTQETSAVVEGRVLVKLDIKGFESSLSSLKSDRDRLLQKYKAVRDRTQGQLPDQLREQEQQVRQIQLPSTLEDYIKQALEQITGKGTANIEMADNGFYFI